MLIPKKQKHRKHQKGVIKGKASRGNEVAFGSFGLKALEGSWITERQIEAARRVIVRYIRKQGKMWIRIFADKPVTFKGVEVAMGGGKGDPDHFVAVVKPGTIIFELDGIPSQVAREAFKEASYKLPIKTKFVERSL